MVDAFFDLQLEAGEYPDFIHLVGFLPPGLLVGEDRGGAIASMFITSFHLNLPGYRATGVTISEERVNGPFALLIAKIGYCYAAAVHGLEAFDGHAIRDLLAGRRTDFYNFVGNLAVPEMFGNRHLHSLYLREDRGWLIALVDLFASCRNDPTQPSRPYQVVVGKLC